MVNVKLLTWASAALVSLMQPTNVGAIPATQASGQRDLRSLLTSPARRWSANTTVSFPGSSAFANATDRWSIFSPPTYSAAVRPGTEEDISKVVRLARDYNISFLTRGSGHGFSPILGEFHNGLSLDLSQWNSVRVNSAEHTVTVGPGAVYQDIFDPLYNAGFYMQTGSCSCPSVIGVAIGGGIGREMSQLGLSSDALESVRLVGADGVGKTLSKTSHSDLFWAMRGAGANFGVITSATFRVQTLESNNNGNVWMLDFYLPSERSQEYFNIIEKYYSPMPPKLAGVVVMNYNTTTNKQQVASDWIYWGTEAEARKVLAPILALNATFLEATLPWNKIIEVAGAGYDLMNCENDKPRNTFSINLKAWNATTNQQAYESIGEYYEKYPGGRASQIMLEIFGNNAVAKVPASDSAWPWRDAWGYFQNQFVYDPKDKVTEQASTALGTKLRSQYAETSGYGKPVIFVNYARGDEPLENVYADKLPRLSQLKRQYDPHNLFSHYHAIPLSS